MTKDTIALFALYNQKANEGMNAIISSLSAEEWNKPLGGYFKSVRELCSHIFSTDFVYCKRFGNVRNFKTLGDPFFNENYASGTVYFEDKDEYLAKRPAFDQKLRDLTEEFTPEDLAGVLKYTLPNGSAAERNFGGMQLHLYTHSAHHRGMISIYLELLGKPNDYNSFSKIL